MARRTHSSLSTAVRLRCVCEGVHTLPFGGRAAMGSARRMKWQWVNILSLRSEFINWQLHPQFLLLQIRSVGSYSRGRNNVCRTRKRIEHQDPSDFDLSPPLADDSIVVRPLTRRLDIPVLLASVPKKGNRRCNHRCNHGCNHATPVKGGRWNPWPHPPQTWPIALGGSWTKLKVSGNNACCCFVDCL